MRRIRDEPALCLVGGLDAFQHGVHGGGQSADLVVETGLGDPAVEIAARDLGHLRPDGLDGLEGPTGQDPGERAGQDGEERQHDGQGEGDVMGGVFDRLGGGHDVDGHGSPSGGHGGGDGQARVVGPVHDHASRYDGLVTDWWALTRDLAVHREVRGLRHHIALGVDDLDRQVGVYLGELVQGPLGHLACDLGGLARRAGRQVGLERPVQLPDQGSAPDRQGHGHHHQGGQGDPDPHRTEQRPQVPCPLPHDQPPPGSSR